MKERTVVVKTVMNVDGMEWSIDVSLSIEADTMRLFSDRLAISLTALLGAGLRPARTTPLDRPAGVDERPMPEVAALAFPQCPNCKRDMKESNVQPDAPKLASFFCPGKLASGYCRYRATVNAETGELKTWEVKG